MPAISREASARRLLRRVQVVLVSPRSPGNLGAAARAIKNLGLGRLSVVEPVTPADPELHEREARRLAVHAHDVLARATFHDTLAAALAPGSYLVATTSRRDRSLPLATPRDAAPRLIALAGRRPLALLFGAEDHGLPNRLLAQASEGLCIPAAARYPSLNLAQAVMVVGYELRLAALAPAREPAARPGRRATAAVPAAELAALEREASEALVLCDFLKPHNRARVGADLAALLARADPDRREVRMLRGICRQVRWLAGRAARG